MRIREATDGREIRDYSWKEWNYLKFEREWDKKKEKILEEYFAKKMIYEKVA